MHQAEAVDKPDRYNIVGEARLDNLELAQTIARIMNKGLKFEYQMVDFHSTRPGHDKHYGLDGTKLEKTGWQAPQSFEESMKNTVKWQTDNPDWL